MFESGGERAGVLSLSRLDFVGCVNISNGLVPKWRDPVLLDALDYSINKGTERTIYIKVRDRSDAVCRRGKRRKWRRIGK